MAVGETGECQRFHFKGKVGFKNASWVSLQVGRNRMFQVNFTKGRFRILKMDPTQRCFGIERVGAAPKNIVYGFGNANFIDKFVFLSTQEHAYRYSLAEDK